MRIRVKDPNGIIKLTRTERTPTFRRGQFQILANEIGTQKFSVSIKDYGKGWSEYREVDINVVESETVAPPTITTSAPYESEVGSTQRLEFGDSNDKLLTNPNSEYDIGVTNTNSAITFRGYTPGIYKFVLTNQKLVGYISDNANKDYDIEASEYIKSEPLEFEVEIAKTIDNEKCSLVKLSIKPETEIYNFDSAVMMELLKDKIPEEQEPKQLFIRRLKLKCKPKNNNPYVVNPQTQNDILTNNGYTACIYNISQDETDTANIDKTLFQEVLIQNGETWVDYRGNEFEGQDGLEIVSKNDETYITQNQEKLGLDTYAILEMELYIIIGSKATEETV